MLLWEVLDTKRLISKKSNLRTPTNSDLSSAKIDQVDEPFLALDYLARMIRFFDGTQIDFDECVFPSIIDLSTRGDHAFGGLLVTCEDVDSRLDRIPYKGLE
jgi:hypothetical protein